MPPGPEMGPYSLRSVPPPNGMGTLTVPPLRTMALVMTTGWPLTSVGLSVVPLVIVTLPGPK